MEGAGVGNVGKSFAVCILTRQQGKRSMTHVNLITASVVQKSLISNKKRTVVVVIIRTVRSGGDGYG